MDQTNYVAKQGKSIVLLDQFGQQQRIASDIKEAASIFVNESGGSEPIFELPAQASKGCHPLSLREQNKLTKEITWQKTEAYGISSNELSPRD
jgi:hypothetical protein